MGQVAVPDDSVLQSAENAVEAVRGWLWNTAKIDLDELHVHFQMRSLSEGALGQGVSGPSAGLTMLTALVSELVGIGCPSSKVMTGTIGIKLDVGPVGGLGGYGSETGKLVGILKTKRVRITDLFVPKVNYEKARDEMNVLHEEEVRVHPVSSAREMWHTMFGLDETAILERIELKMMQRNLERKEKRDDNGLLPRRSASATL